MNSVYTFLFFILFISSVTANDDDDEFPRTSWHVLNEFKNVCGISSFGGQQNRIAGGIDVQLQHFHWMAILLYLYTSPQVKEEFECTGTTISPFYVLTAAHCIKPNLYKVRVGDYDRSKSPDCDPNNIVCAPDPQELRIQDMFIHPDFKAKNKVGNDIGLIRLKTPIDMESEFFWPICLPHQTPEFVDTEGFGFLGWGKTGPHSPRSQVLQYVFLPYVDKTVCQVSYPKRKFNEGEFCAGTVNYKNTCPGDSGGPAMGKFFNDDNALETRWFQLGILSIGSSSCSKPSIFTNVTYYMDWILDRIRS